MTDEAPPSNVIRFPGRGGDPPRPPPPKPSFGEWPPFPVEVESPPGDASPWLEAEVSRLTLAALAFTQALSRLGTIDHAAVEAEVAAFRRATGRLLRTVELLRLRRIHPHERRALADGVRQVASRLRAERQAVLAILDEDASRRLSRREGRIHLGARDLDDELARRSQRRQAGATQAPAARIHLQGELLAVPGPDVLAARARRKLRADQDLKPIDPEAEAASLLATLPAAWVEGMALRLAGEIAADARSQVAELLASPKALRELLRSLAWGPRRILEALLAAGGVSRYDLITHGFGPDDETAWDWRVDPPRADLERLRRAGLVYAGAVPEGPEGEVQRKIAVVPVDLRGPLLSLLDEHPPPPVPLRR